MRRTAITAALATVLAGAAPAAADKRDEPLGAEAQVAGGSATAVVGVDKAAAERLAVAAKARFDARDYPAAIAGYGAAYRRHPSPGLLFNLAQAYRLHGNCAAASLMYHEYLRAAPSSPYRTLAEQHLDALSDCSRGQAFAISAAGGASGTAADALLVPADRQPGRGKRVAGVAVGVAGMAMAATGAYLLMRDDGTDAAAFLDKDKDEDDDDATARDPAAESARRRNELIGAGLIGAGSVAVISGVTLYVLGRRDERAARTTFAVTPARGGGLSASVAWRF